MTLWSKSPPRYEGLGKRWAEEHEAAISANLARISHAGGSKRPLFLA